MMPDRTMLRLGSASAILGALLALVTNFLHPRLSDYDDPVAEELRVVAESDGWIAIHLGILLATLLITAGLYAASRTLVDQGVETWRRMAVGSLLISTPVTIATLGVDGYATKAVADALVGGGQAALAAGTAVRHVGWGFAMLLTITFLGVTPILFGLAVAKSEVYPAAFGWPVVVLGLVSLVAGVLGTVDGPSATFFLVFWIASGLLTLWVLGLGISMWRRVSEAAPAPAKA
jgi:hypothetical protein